MKNNPEKRCLAPHQIVGNWKEVTIGCDEDATKRRGVRHLIAVAPGKQMLILGGDDVDPAPPQPDHDASVDALIGVQAKRHRRRP